MIKWFYNQLAFSTDATLQYNLLPREAKFVNEVWTHDIWSHNQHDKLSCHIHYSSNIWHWWPTGGLSRWRFGTIGDDWCPPLCLYQCDRYDSVDRSVVVEVLIRAVYQYVQFHQLSVKTLLNRRENTVVSSAKFGRKACHIRRRCAWRWRETSPVHRPLSRLIVRWYNLLLWAIRSDWRRSQSCAIGNADDAANSWTQGIIVCQKERIICPRWCLLLLLNALSSGYNVNSNGTSLASMMHWMKLNATLVSWRTHASFNDALCWNEQQFHQLHQCIDR